MFLQAVCAVRRLPIGVNFGEMTGMVGGRSLRVSALAALVLLWGSGCGEHGQPSDVERNWEGVVNGEDDRRQWFDVMSAQQRAALSGGVAALIWSHHLDFDRDDLLRFVSLQQAAGVCPDVAFANEPSVAWCSATLIDSDLMLTAGHCLGRDAAAVTKLCQQLRVVFDYHYAQPGELALDAPEDVYSCRRVAHYEYAATDAGFRDVAVIQLDRVVSADRHPMSLGVDTANVGDSLIAATHGAGLPLKVDAGGVVTEVAAGAAHFLASTDSFAGGSGGPVFNAALELLAHQVRGLPDWESDGQCMRPAYAERASEQHQWAKGSVAGLCDGGWPSERLCGRAAGCGDGICNGGESSADCQADCPLPHCGDGFCEVNERVECALDCAPYREVPPSWREAPANFRSPDVGGSAGAGVTRHTVESASGCGVVRRRNGLLFGVIMSWLVLFRAVRCRRGAGVFRGRVLTSCGRHRRCCR
jgi:hypothetical protein